MKEKKESGNIIDSLVFSFGLIGEIGFAVAIPLYIFIRLGQYLDDKYNTGYFTYGGIVIATILIVAYLRLTIRRAIKGAEKLMGLSNQKSIRQLMDKDQNDRSNRPHNHP